MWLFDIVLSVWSLECPVMYAEGALFVIPSCPVALAALPPYPFYLLNPVLLEG